MDDRNFLDKIIAPDRETQRKKREAISRIGYYLVIATISIFAMLVIPFFAGGIQGDFKLYFPQSTIGWIVYWIIRGGMAVLNIALFALFKLQAKVNIKEDPNYIKANEILHKLNGKLEKKPRSPKQMNAKEWTSKGITVFITSLIMGATLSALVLVFDLVTFLSCISTVVMGVLFGYCTMRNNEMYWTGEYLEYAELKAKEIEEALEPAKEQEKEESENVELRKQGIQEHTGTSTEEC